MKVVINAGILAFAGLGAISAIAAEGDEHLDEYYDLLNEYCVTCHNFIDQTPAGRPLELDYVDLGNLEEDIVLWERVVRRLARGQMPPQEQPHPNPAELQEFQDWLVASLDAIAEARNDPGEFVFRRLNRTEYGNAVRDIFGLDLDISEFLPTDSSVGGFDNVASSLTLTPTLMELYLSAAMKISSLVVGDPEVVPVEKTFPIRKDINQDYYVEGLPLGTRGGTLVRYNFPADGEYTLSADLIQTVGNSDVGVEGEVVPHTFEILVDGVRVHSAEIGGPEDHLLGLQSMSTGRAIVEERMRSQVFISAGPHDIGFTFVAHPDLSEDIYKPAQRASLDVHVGAGSPALTSVKIVGPFNISGVSDNSLRDRLYTCDPEVGSPSEACARDIISRVARLAYRRPLSDTEINSIMPYFNGGVEAQGSFDGGMRLALSRILTSPFFLLRAESDPQEMAPGTAHPITDLELASRLSFFLWSSVPDDELLTVAEEDRLREPGVLEQQIRRMMEDERSRALTTNFPDQWLALRNLDNVQPDFVRFPTWDYTLRLAAQEETRLLFDSLIRENRSVLELLSADYTFVNERLAEHYGIEGVYGTAFTRIQHEDPNRFGLFGQAGILALTSTVTRTSPVLRGKWVLEHLVGTPPLPPPPNVDTTLSETAESAPASVRERLEAHRENPVCDSCHRSLDPIGFALENYNAVGQWREVEEVSGIPVDASSMLYDGTPVDSPYSLSQAILSRPDVFVEVVAEKLMTYALGREMEAKDMPLVRDVVRKAKADDYRFMSLITAIIESPAFQERKKPLESGINLSATQ